MAFNDPYGGTDPVYPSINMLIDQIPVFLFSSASMPSLYSIYEDKFFEEKSYDNPELEYKGEEKPSSEWLGFYRNKEIISGVTTPIIGLCPERIMKCVNNDEELMFLIAKVIVHEFAHAQMNYHPSLPENSLCDYYPKDELYKWMEESLANLITLSRFKFFEASWTTPNVKSFASISITNNPLDFVKDFVSRQPDNYKLGLDLFNVKAWSPWYKWRDNKARISGKTLEKIAMLDYLKLHLGTGTFKRADYYKLFEDLII
jgi:hypothetical protein